MRGGRTEEWSGFMINLSGDSSDGIARSTAGEHIVVFTLERDIGLAIRLSRPLLMPEAVMPMRQNSA